MKKNLFILALAALVLAVSCARTESDFKAATAAPNEFTAYFQKPDAETKVYMDDNFHMFWNSYGGDYISVFTGGIHSKYISTQVRESGPDLANYAVFSKVEGADKNTGLNLDRNYAVYPYNEAAAIDADGTIHTWVDDDYHMAAVTKDADDHILCFKALCGYLVVDVAGTGVITGIAFRGNNGEVLMGDATVKLAYGKDPVVTMADKGETEIRYSDFYEELTPVGSRFMISLPPVTFKNGFTVEFTDIQGKVYTFRTDKERTIQRNVYNSMDQVKLNCANYALYSSVSEAQADLDQLYSDIGYPGLLYSKPDDWGFLANMFSNDAEGSDLLIKDSGYNWFSVCGDYTRSNSFRNSAIRFLGPWNMVKGATKVLAGLAEMNSDNANYIKGQARALRAYSYLALAENLQFGFAQNPDAPCAPILNETLTDTYGMSLSTVREVYDFIVDDLAVAEASLQGFTRQSAAQINLDVVHALQARAYLLRGEWTAAYDYAMRAAVGYSPASMEEVSVPSFMDITEHNWIWGYDMTESNASNYPFATTSSWLRSFSANSYSAATGCYAFINKLLYDLIPSTDVRKGWWVNQNLESPLLDGLAWPGFDDVANADDGGYTKLAYFPYVNVKFGCNPIGTEVNSEDMPLIRVEEMILVQAECAARLGQEATALRLLNTFIINYRDPSYNASASPRSLLDEIWFQRRVELWGEGFGRGDIVRLGKPLVRFVPGKDTNVPYSYMFNIEPGDQHFLLPIPYTILRQYPNIESNYDYLDYVQPESGSNLRDGITD